MQNLYNSAVQVFEKLKQAEITSKEIEEVRDGYRPAARRGAVLFFVLSEMAAINSMYQYSLSSYLDVSVKLCPSNVNCDHVTPTGV